MQERKFRFARMGDGFYIVEFVSPNELLPYQEHAQDVRHPRKYSASFCRADAVMGVSCGMEIGGQDIEQESAFGVAQCETYEDAYAIMNDYIKENGGQWVTAIHDVDANHYAV